MLTDHNGASPTKNPPNKQQRFQLTDSFDSGWSPGATGGD